MFIIEYNRLKSRFEVIIRERDYESFQESVNYLRQFNLYFDRKENVTHFHISRLEEIMLWFKKYKIDYYFGDHALLYIQENKDKRFVDELKTYRRIQPDYSILNSHITPFEFQKEAIHWRLSRNRYLDAFDPGLGKSFLNAFVFSQRFKEKLVDGVIILVPPGMAYNWKYEIKEFINLFEDPDIAIINNENKHRPFEKFKNSKILIIPHHIFHQCLLSYKPGYSYGDASSISWKEFVNIPDAWGKSINLQLIVDESHAFKHSKSIKTKALDSIKHLFEYRSMLSATPAINRIEHYYPQIKILNPGHIKMEENAFRLWIADFIGNKYDKYAVQSYNSHNVEVFLNSLPVIMTKKLKKDIPEMKAKQVVKIIALEMGQLQKEIYQAVIEEEIQKLVEDNQNITWELILNKLPSMCKAIDNPLLLKDSQISNLKLNHLLSQWSLDKDPKFEVLVSKVNDYVDNLGEKLIIYDVHPGSLDMMATHFAKYNPIIIHGSLQGIKDKEIDRREKQEKFNNDPTCKLAFLSALTSSQGINLQKSCHRILLYASPFDSTQYRQLIDRTYRINSVDDTVVEILMLDQTLDNIRVKRNLNRVELNDKAGKTITRDELKKLLAGIV